MPRTRDMALCLAPTSVALEPGLAAPRGDTRYPEGPGDALPSGVPLSEGSDMLLLIWASSKAMSASVAPLTAFPCTDATAGNLAGFLARCVVPH